MNHCVPHHQVDSTEPVPSYKNIIERKMRCALRSLLLANNASQLTWNLLCLALHVVKRVKVRVGSQKSAEAGVVPVPLIS